MRHKAEEIAFLTDLLDQIGEERDAMTVVELDGFVAGLVFCPEWIGPAEWLPLVWDDNRSYEATREPALRCRFLPTHRETRYVPIERDRSAGRRGA